MIWQRASLLAGALTTAVLFGAASGNMPSQATQQSEQKSKLDIYGDPLPPGAIARLGTVKYRADGVALGFLPDSRTLVVPASRPDGPRIQLWDAVTGALQREIIVDASSLLSSALSHDGKWIALAVYLPHKDDELIPGEVQIWDLASGKKIKTLKRNGDDVIHSALAFSPDDKLLFSIGKDQMVCIEEIATGQEVLRYKFPKGVVGKNFGGSIGSSPDGKVLAIGGLESCFLWDWKAGEKPLELKNPDRQRRSWTFSPDGRLFLQCSKEMRVWDVASGNLVRTLKPPEKGDYFASASYSPDGSTLYFSRHIGEKDVVEVWDAATWEFKHRIDSFYVGHVYFSPDGRLLAGKSGQIRVWDKIAKKELSANDAAHRNSVNLVASFRDLVVTAGEDSTIRIWDVKSGKHKAKMTHGKSALGIGRQDADLSPDGTKLVTLSPDGSVCIWDTTNGEQIHKLPANGRLGGQRAVAFTPDGKYFLSYGDAMYLRKWEVATGKVVREHWISPDGRKKEANEPDKKKNASLTDIIFNRFDVGGFSADGKSLVLIKPPDIRFFDVETGELRNTLHFSQLADGPAAFSPDNRLMLVSTTGNGIQNKLPDGRLRLTYEKQHMVYLWELSTQAVRMKLVLAGQRPGPMIFSPDGKMFAVGTTEAPASIRLWDVGSGKELPPITGFRGTARSLAFTSDSTRLISGMEDSTALVWELNRR